MTDYKQHKYQHKGVLRQKCFTYTMVDCIMVEGNQAVQGGKSTTILRFT